MVIKIDENKIVKGQMKYVLKLMELAKDSGQQERDKEILEIIDKWNIVKTINVTGGETRTCRLFQKDINELKQALKQNG
jgi:hypothetical protein